VVLLLVDQVVLGARTDHVPPELVRPLLLLVLHHIEEDLAVAGPCDRVTRAIFSGPSEPLRQVADVQVVLAEARLVRRVGELGPVVADLPTARPRNFLPAASAFRSRMTCSAASSAGLRHRIGYCFPFSVRW